MRANISNKDVGTRLGLDYTSVSRIRAGERHPSLEVMMKIEMWLSWQLSDQAVARFKEPSEYAPEFEKKLAALHGEVTDDETGTETTPA